MKTLVQTAFVQHVAQGLSQSPKHLSSRYFYDERGSSLFQKIMNLDTYYPTRCEYAIFSEHKQAILENFQPANRPFRLIELGAGDGLKTKVLLKHFISQHALFSYTPIDISGEVLGNLRDDLYQRWPTLEVDAREGDYFDMLSDLAEESPDKRKVVMFAGANIGNFEPEAARAFLRAIREHLAPGDLLFIGFDLKKDPRVVLKAYDDPEGITRDFNLNLLRRINRELDADFDLEQFQHYPTYNPLTGECRSYLVSRKSQLVRLGALNQTVSFDAWETLSTELSKKYDPGEVEQLAADSGFRATDWFFDENHWFADVIWEIA